MRGLVKNVGNGIEVGILPSLCHTTTSLKKTAAAVGTPKRNAGGIAGDRCRNVGLRYSVLFHRFAAHLIRNVKFNITMQILI